MNAASLTIPEVIQRAQKMDTNEEKIRYLRQYRNRNLRWFVATLYDNQVAELSIPIPQYTPTHYPVGMAPMSFKTAITRFENACRLWDTNRGRAENLLVLVLESVSEDEANLFKMILLGQKKFEGISKAVWKGVYPELFQSGSS